MLKSVLKNVLRRVDATQTDSGLSFAGACSKDNKMDKQREVNKVGSGGRIGWTRGKA